MQEYFTTIRHQSAVQRLGTRDIYLRVIYSHVLSFTQSDGGWTGTYQDMACQILLSPSTICRALNRLLQSGLVRRQDSNTYVAVIDRNTSSTVAVSNEPVAGGNQSVAGSNSPDNPLSTYPTDGNEACTHSRDAPAPQDFSFPEFCRAYRARGGRITPQQHTDSYALWCSMTPLKRQAILDELTKLDGFWRSRPDWLLSDYQLPQPKNYNRSSEFDQAINTTPLVSASYNGAFGIYTLNDARKYGMVIKCGMNFKYEPDTIPDIAAHPCGHTRY